MYPIAFTLVLPPSLIQTGIYFPSLSILKHTKIVIPPSCSHPHSQSFSLSHTHTLSHTRSLSRTLSLTHKLSLSHTRSFTYISLSISLSLSFSLLHTLPSSPFNVFLTNESFSLAPYYQWQFGKCVTSIRRYSPTLL